jgi:signal transduction histidine kinase
MSGSPPVAAWPVGWHPSRGDLALAVLFGLLGLQGASDADGVKDPAWAVIGLIECTALPLAWRSLWPLPVLGITLAAAVAGDLLFGGLQLAGPVIALYTVARRHDRRVSLAAAAVTAVGLAVPAASRAAESPLFAMAICVVLVAAWAIGDNVRRRHAYLTRVQAREAAIEEEQRERARVAVSEERARIARELHDVISHNVSVMVLQAAAGADVFATHPERSREALGAIEAAGREALAELRRLLSVVDAPGDEGAGLAPPPGLTRLPELVERVRATGLDVCLTVTGDDRALPAGIDFSAYRIVQEALTNTLKHGHAATARVNLRVGERMLDVEIVDDGTAAARADARTGRGHGLIGMRERAAVFGGELQAGPRSGGGFAVRASIPLDGASR